MSMSSSSVFPPSRIAGLSSGSSSREAAASTFLSSKHSFASVHGMISLRKKGIAARTLRIDRRSSSAAFVVFSKAKEITEDVFESTVLKAELPVLVDFWAEWCGPCKLVAPIVDWASENYAGKLEVYKVDSDKCPALVDRYKPYGLPTLVLFKDGVEVQGSRKEGAITKAKLKAHLDNLLDSTVVV